MVPDGFVISRSRVQLPPPGPANRVLQEKSYFFDGSCARLAQAPPSKQLEQPSSPVCLVETLPLGLRPW